MKKKNAYVVITHSSAPNPHSRGPQDAVIVSEYCEFVTSLSTKRVKQSTAIIDYVAKQVYKTRDTNKTFEDYDNYLRSEYKEKMQLLDLILDGKTLQEIVDGATVGEDSPAAEDTQNVGA